MNIKAFIRPANWAAGVLGYLALSLLPGWALAQHLVEWSYPSANPMYVRLEVQILIGRIFETCLFWGTLYASTFAKPAAFGQSVRIWKHLGLSYGLNMAGCILLACVFYLPFPDFDHNAALSAYPFVIASIGAVCFLAAFAAWVHLAFASWSLAVESAPEEPARAH